MKRRAVLVSAVGAALVPLSTSAQQETPVVEGERERIARDIRWEQDVFVNGDVELLRELASPNYRSPYTPNAPGVDPLVERATEIVRSQSQLDDYYVMIEHAIATGQSVALRKRIVVEARGRIASAYDVS